MSPRRKRIQGDEDLAAYLEAHKDDGDWEEVEFERPTRVSSVYSIRFTAQELDALHAVAVSIAIGLAPDPEDIDVPNTFRLALEHTDRETETDLVHGEFQIGVPADALPGTEPRVVTAVPLVLSLSEEGRFLVKLYVGGRELQSVSFVLAHQPQ